jgi:glycosyltransferase involved in cell wall biosynthesis
VTADGFEAVVSVVVPTRNRAELAYKRARWALAEPLVREVVFVVDAAEDDTVARLRSLADHDARLRLIVNERNVGPPKAKNMGVRAATSEWVLVIDDDDVPSDNLIAELLTVAIDGHGDVVGVPWFNVAADDSIDAVVARAPRVPGGPKLDQPGLFPVEDWEECLWIHANALFRRTVFDKVSYDEFYFGSCYREENDLFVSAARAGFRVLVTGRGHTYMTSRVGGGINHKSKLRYEYSVVRNSLHFLGKHGAWLRDNGLIKGSVHEQSSLMAKRVRPLARAGVRKVARVVRS